MIRFALAGKLGNVRPAGPVTAVAPAGVGASKLASAVAPSDPAVLPRNTRRLRASWTRRLSVFGMVGMVGTFFMVGPWSLTHHEFVKIDDHVGGQRVGSKLLRRDAFGRLHEAEAGVLPGGIWVGGKRFPVGTKPHHEGG